jgi:hypothetical protein
MSKNKIFTSIFVGFFVIILGVVFLLYAWYTEVEHRYYKKDITTKVDDSNLISIYESIKPSKFYSKIDFPFKKDIFEGNYTYTVSFDLDSEIVEAIHIKEIKISYLGNHIDAFSNNFTINYQKIFTKDQLEQFIATRKIIVCPPNKAGDNSFLLRFFDIEIPFTTVEKITTYISITIDYKSGENIDLIFNSSFTRTFEKILTSLST